MGAILTGTVAVVVLLGAATSSPTEPSRVGGVSAVTPADVPPTPTPTPTL
jgi:hypothetical protein